MKSLKAIAGVLAAAALLPLQAGAAEEGMALFVEKCGMCHRAGGMGAGLLARRNTPDKGLLEQRDGLTAEFIETVIRTGLGNMPRITRAEVSDAQLAIISSYLSGKDKK
ncbi:MAG: cytochrome c [Gammaproteobacteria bacterium]|nr:cytochrome c [Gammaproteobacteria bacterium]